MKIFIASDIHGSAGSCRRVLEAYEREGAEKLVLLGDLLYHGPRNDLPADYAPKEVIDLLNAHAADILAVRGNCDTEVDQMVLTFPIMADYAYLFDGQVRIFVTHGHHFNLQTPPPLSPGDILLHGHTHVPVCQAFGNENLYMNPGSCAIPKDGSWKGYMMYEDGAFVWKDFEGNVKMEYGKK